MPFSPIVVNIRLLAETFDSLFQSVKFWMLLKVNATKLGSNANYYGNYGMSLLLAFGMYESSVYQKWPLR